MTPQLLSPTRDKRRTIFLLRGLILVGVGGLLVDDGPRASDPAALLLLLAFAASNALLCFTPLRLIGRQRFELLVGGGDILLVGLGIHLAGSTAGALSISCLVMAVVVALGSHRTQAVAGAAAVGALHFWLVISMATAPPAGHLVLLQTLFLCSVGLYCGYLTEGIHRSRRTEEAEDLEPRELTALLEILEAITSSLDLREVTRAIVTKVATIVPAVRCSMLHIQSDDAGQHCTVLASHDAPELPPMDLDLAKYPEIRHVPRQREPLVIPDVNSDPLLAGVRDSLRHLDFHSLLVVPLTFGEDLLGTLCLKSARAGQSFSPQELNFCVAVAKASANCLRNGVLHRRVLEQSALHRTAGEKLKSILDHSPELIFTTDTEGRISEFNRGAERLLGHRREDVLGQPLSLLQDSGEAGDLVSRIRRAAAVCNHASRLKNSDGQWLEVEISLAALRNEAGEPTGTVWIGRDVSELKAAQQHLLQAEKLSSIGNVVSFVAHELNNPLTGVVGFSQLLLARHGGGPLSRDLQRISEAALRCQKIVGNLLSFVRHNKPERRYLGVDGILERALELMRCKLYVSNIEIVPQLDAGLPLTMLDFHQMEQVFLNLFNNAQQAIAASGRPPGRIRVRTFVEGGTIHAEIIDNGVGMDPATLDRIFEPFLTTKDPGQGTELGLSVSYGIVKAHGGRVFASSRKGEGSTFTVELPILREETREGGTKADGGSAPFPRPAAPARILIDDDEPVVLDLLLDILKHQGHQLDTASSGLEACRKVGARPHDLVITDLRMPQMGGTELYRRILSVRPELINRVIFMTGDLIDPEILEFLGSANAPTLPKPLDIARLATVVQEALLKAPGTTTEA